MLKLFLFLLFIYSFEIEQSVSFTFEPCQAGYYRLIKNQKTINRVEGCILCPRGRYGATIGLTSSKCSAPCPKGRYGDFLGSSSQDDCTLCPFDTYGPSEGSTNPRCTKCPDGTYNPNTGSTSINDCIKCPPNYFGNQCYNQFDIVNQDENKYFTSNSNLQTSSQIQKTTKSNKESSIYGGKCGGLNNVCITQHIVSYM